ncbi:6-hydroxynicotinate 3-monooxygenase [Carex littledalei]|uniref:6-hydroxynicotinate 3-monooxygenase n=1 Tax=Carex littledalei TaxID=544730 RepID=A0A833VLY3_9POAL|nr:6-hydroxynicotinate 3-monooxygenase [Carex littledalei]
MEAIEDIVIVGGGLAGLATALGLHRKGIKCLILESSPDLRTSGFGLTMWTNAWRAMDALGIGDKLREHHVLVVAKYLGLKKLSFSGRLATRGLTEYETEHGFQPGFFQIIGGGHRAGVITCSDKSVYWFLTWITSEENKNVDQSVEKMKDYVIGNLKHANKSEETLELIDRSEMGNVISTPLKYRSPFSLMFAKIAEDNVCVAGDALHATTPEIGQGGCMALEDSVVLARCLSEAIIGSKRGCDEEYERIQGALEKYAKERRWRSIKVITLSYIVGFIQQSANPFVSFLRERLLARVIANVYINFSNYDCGKL